MKIEVFGTGCAKCEALATNVKAAAEKLGLDCEIEKITDITRIMTKGVMMTPALVIDGEIKVSGKVPSVEEIQRMIS